MQLLKSAAPRPTCFPLREAASKLSASPLACNVKHRKAYNQVRSAVAYDFTNARGASTKACLRLRTSLDLPWQGGSKLSNYLPKHDDEIKGTKA